MHGGDGPEGTSAGGLRSSSVRPQAALVGPHRSDGPPRADADTPRTRRRRRRAGVSPQSHRSSSPEPPGRRPRLLRTGFTLSRRAEVRRRSARSRPRPPGPAVCAPSAPVPTLRPCPASGRHRTPNSKSRHFAPRRSPRRRAPHRDHRPTPTEPRRRRPACAARTASHHPIRHSSTPQSNELARWGFGRFWPRP